MWLTQRRLQRSVQEGNITEDVSEDAEDKHHEVNGQVCHADIDVLAQIIGCSEPPMVKTERVNMSDAP